MIDYKFKKIVFDSFPVLLASIAIAFVAGHLLESYFVHLEDRGLLAIVLTMMPILNGVGGNIGSILGTRLTSALHMGVIRSRLRRQETLNTNLIASVILGIGAFAFSVLFIFFRAQMLGPTVGWSLRAALVFFSAGLILTGIVVFTAVTAAFLSYVHRIDPDNVVVPVVTSIVDVLGLISLLIMINIIGV